MRLLPCSQVYLHSSYYCISFSSWLEVTSNGRKKKFLNGKIEQKVFVEQPYGFVLHNKGTHVCKLRKDLYGLKQDPRVWYDMIDGFIKSLDWWIS